jgi:hypothetical protein
MPRPPPEFPPESQRATGNARAKAISTLRERIAPGLHVLFDQFSAHLYVRPAISKLVGCETIESLFLDPGPGSIYFLLRRSLPEPAEGPELSLLATDMQGKTATLLVPSHRVAFCFWRSNPLGEAEGKSLPSPILEFLLGDPLAAEALAQSLASFAAIHQRVALGVNIPDAPRRRHDAL